MAEHFQRLLKQVIARPELCLAELSLLTETEKRQFIEWNSKSALMPLTDNECRLYNPKWSDNNEERIIKKNLYIHRHHDRNLPSW